jgi:hypothetical protein
MRAHFWNAYDHDSDFAADRNCRRFSGRGSAEGPSSNSVSAQRRCPGARPGPANRKVGSGIRITLRAAADHIFIGGGNELERV